MSSLVTGRTSQNYIELTVSPSTPQQEPPKELPRPSVENKESSIEAKTCSVCLEIIQKNCQFMHPNMALACSVDKKCMRKWLLPKIDPEENREQQSQIKCPQCRIDFDMSRAELDRESPPTLEEVQQEAEAIRLQLQIARASCASRTALCGALGFAFAGVFTFIGKEYVPSYVLFGLTGGSLITGLYSTWRANRS